MHAVMILFDGGSKGLCTPVIHDYRCRKMDETERNVPTSWHRVDCVSEKPPVAMGDPTKAVVNNRAVGE